MFDYSPETISKIKTTALAMATCALGSMLGTYNCNYNWQHNLLREGYGEYDRKTGEWQLCEPEVALLNRNTDAIKVLNGGKITINDYLTVIESDLKIARDKLEEQSKELVEQDLLLDKYKKHIKIPDENSKGSKESAKRPLPKIDINKM